jgi:hypothetical protein
MTSQKLVSAICLVSQNEEEKQETYEEPLSYGAVCKVATNLAGKAENRHYLSHILGSGPRLIVALFAFSFSLG